jgi:hypothetical protein
VALILGDMIATSQLMFLVFPWRQAAVAEQIVENSWISKIVKTSTSSFFFKL